MVFDCIKTVCYNSIQRKSKLQSRLKLRWLAHSVVVMRSLLLIGVIMVLLTGGWNAVLAAELCPHITPTQSQQNSSHSISVEAHACCAGRTPEASPHCASSRNSSGDPVDLPSVYQLGWGTFSLCLQSSCAHCAGRSPSLPFVLDRRTPVNRLSDADIEPQTQQSFATYRFSSSPVIAPIRGAPVLLVRKHLLISVFLI